MSINNTILPHPDRYPTPHLFDSTCFTTPKKGNLVSLCITSPESYPHKTLLPQSSIQRNHSYDRLRFSRYRSIHTSTTTLPCSYPDTRSDRNPQLSHTQHRLLAIPKGESRSKALNLIIPSHSLPLQRPPFSSNPLSHQALQNTTNQAPSVPSASFPQLDSHIPHPNSKYN